MTAQELRGVLAWTLSVAAGLVDRLWFVREAAGVLLLFGFAEVLAIVLYVPVTWLERKGFHHPSPPSSSSRSSLGWPAGSYFRG